MKINNKEAVIFIYLFKTELYSKKLFIMSFKIKIKFIRFKIKSQKLRCLAVY